MADETLTVSYVRRASTPETVAVLRAIKEGTASFWKPRLAVLGTAVAGRETFPATELQGFTPRAFISLEVRPSVFGWLNSMRPEKDTRYGSTGGRDPFFMGYVYIDSDVPPPLPHKNTDEGDKEAWGAIMEDHRATREKHGPYAV